MNTPAATDSFPNAPASDCLEQLRELESFLSTKLDLYLRSGLRAPSLFVTACKEIHEILARGLEVHAGVVSLPRSLAEDVSAPVRRVLARAVEHPPIAINFELAMELDHYLLEAAREEMAKLIV